MRLTFACLLALFLSQATAAASTRCFDNERFCLSLVADDSGTSLTLYRGAPLPVVVTVYSPLLPGHHISHFLADDAPVTLATLNAANAFWRSMRVRWTLGVLNAAHDDTVRYSPPLTPIAQHPIVQGYNGNYSHTGSSQYALDFAADVGTPVLAARGGVVIDIKADSNTGGPSEDYADDANYIAILHEDGTTGEYYHLKFEGVLVTRGQTITRGQHIGYTGNTGFSSLPHLHFAVYSARPHGRFSSLPVRFSPPLSDKRAP